MAKVRVYELAKELGLESKELLGKLKDMGEFVRSASSTIEAPVVRRVTEKIKSDQGGAAPAPEKEKPAASSTDKLTATLKPGPVPTPRVVTKTADGGRTQPPPEPPVADTPAAAGTVTTPSLVAPRPFAPKPGVAKPGVVKPAAPKVGDAPPSFSSPSPGQTEASPSPQHTVAAETPRAARPTPGPRPPVSRPGASGGLPTQAKPGAAAAQRRPGAPRPGNNPFAPSQGMGQRRPGGQPGQGAAPRGPRPGADAQRMPRPGGTSGLPRPNPAMMPKQASGQLAQPGTRPGRPGGPGRGRPGGAGRPGVGGAPQTGGPAGGGRGGRGGRGGSGTQGAFGRGGAQGRRGRKSKKQRRQEFDQMQAPSIGGVRIKPGDGSIIRIRRGSSLTDLAEKIGVDAAALVQVLFNQGEKITATQSLPDETLEILGAELNYTIQVVSPEDEDRELLESFDLEFGEDEGGEEELEQRPPVVTVMGHVDHGKTKLLDALRDTDVQGKEAGGITQSIGAYQVSATVDGQQRRITFIDTPGHEAFTAMRARGAKSTDIAVLVVAADDGVMPQTIEALNHAKAADVPVVVAVNKIDKPNADPMKVRGQLMEFGLTPEEYGGETMFVNVSAVTHEGLDQLLEAIALTADAELDLRANPSMDAQGVSVEAHLDQGRGPVATVLIQRGTLHKGDSIVAGSAYGRVRAMMDSRGELLTEAPPSMPVQVLGLTSVPGAGDTFLVVEDDRMARQIAEKRAARMRAAQQAKTSRRKTLDELFEQMKKGETSELLLILKGDSAGSVEAIEDSLAKIDVGEEVSLRVIDRGVGAITETNVSLAAASEPHAVIIGFGVRPTHQASQMADRENVDIRYYSVIYDAIDEIEAALKGMLKPIFEEKQLGTAEVRQVFHSSKIGNIAGCMVMSGIMRRNAKARLIRDGVVIAETTIQSLKREKDDATEVREGYECGLTVGYSDIKLGDEIETYEMVEKARS